MRGRRWSSCLDWVSHKAQATMNHSVASILISTLRVQMTHLMKCASFALLTVCYFHANVFSSAHQPAWTHSILQFVFLSLHLTLCTCLPLILSTSFTHPPTDRSSPVPQPPFQYPATLLCLPLGKEMRRGTHANILDPSLLPDSSHSDRNKVGRKRGARKRWKVQRDYTEKQTYSWLVHNGK